MINPESVYQFRIDLCDIKPPIWRRIQVPSSYTFVKLHDALSDAMGWQDYHLHEFIFKRSQGSDIVIGDPSHYEDYPVGQVPDVLNEQIIRISQFFIKPHDRGIYIYDFGDYWNHIVLLEKILPKEEGISYPRCIKGKRRCPPEDVGGTGGYEDLLRVMNDPNDEEYENMMSWCGGPYDPDYFDCAKIKFRGLHSKSKK